MYTVNDLIKFTKNRTLYFILIPEVIYLAFIC